MSGGGDRGHRSVLAGAMIAGWIGVAGGPAAAQQGAEVRENLGNYVIGRRVTGQGTTIQTVLYRGLQIAIDLIIPAADGTSAATGAAAASGAAPGPRAPVGVGTAMGNGESGDGTGAPRPFDFVGTLLSGEISGDYFILHRMRAKEPPTHDIFRDGEKIGFVAEQALPKGVGSTPGRTGNSFSFESAGDRFIVHLTQPDGTRIHATFEKGRFSRQTVERAEATGASTPAARPPRQPPPGVPSQ
jgi:hypothetical protein